MTYVDVENKIEIWGYARGIIQHGKPMGQAIKTLEEVTELLAAINAGDNPEEITDAIGDIGVTLLMICAQRGITFTECLEAAYECIKDRKGMLLPSGVFVKEQ
jgi:phosphoribosyl-ATP pyrophosphohydrolase